MKLKIAQFIQMWNYIDQIYALNDSFPPYFEAAMANNFKIFAPLINQVKGREEELQDKEIEVPLTQLTISSLPDKVPVGTMQALKPLLIDFEETEFNSTLDELITNGQTEKEPATQDSN